MTKLVKNLIIGGSATAVVGGGAAGAAVAVSHSHKANSTSVADKFKLDDEARAKLQAENKSRDVAQVEIEWTSKSSEMSDFMVANQSKMTREEIATFSKAFTTFNTSKHTTEAIYEISHVESEIEAAIDFREKINLPVNRDKILTLENAGVEDEVINSLKSISELDALVAKTISK